MAPRAGNKLGVSMFEAKVFRESVYSIEESICDIAETFRRPGQCAPLAPFCYAPGHDPLVGHSAVSVDPGIKTKDTRIDLSRHFNTTAWWEHIDCFQ